MIDFTELAMEEARFAMEQGEVPVGAVIVKDGELIAKAHNLVEKTKDPTAHAEMLAIREALRKTKARNLAGCSLYVTLEPCAMCTGAIHISKIDRVYFGAYDPKSGACGGKTDIPQSGCFDYKTEIYAGIREPECEQRLVEFFHAIRKEEKSCGGI